MTEFRSVALVGEWDGNARVTLEDSCVARVLL